MEIILKKDVQNLGFKDDVVNVKNGYGRNYLIPKGHAVIANEAAKKMHPKAVTLSAWENIITKEPIHQTTPIILIVDSIGLLRNLYQYATITYTGGGFTKDGIHNVLEPAAFGRSVIWGPNDEKYREAIGLRNAGGGIQIKDVPTFKKSIDALLVNNSSRKDMGEKAANYINENAGATNATLAIIQEKRLLTN